MSKRSINVLVTGSCGFVGKSLVKELSELNHNVIAGYHEKIPEQRRNLLPTPFNVLEGKDAKFKPALRSIDVIIHLAWQGGISSDQFPENNIRMMHNLCAYAETHKIPKMVLLSVLGASKNAKNSFAKTKYEVERVLVKSAVQEKVIVRSPLIFDGKLNHDQILRSVVRTLKIPGIYAVPAYREEVSLIHVADIIQVMIEFMQSHKPTRNVQDPYPECHIAEVENCVKYSVEDLFKIVSAQNGVKSPIVLKGILGDLLYPMFEKELRKNQRKEPKFRDYLALSQQTRGTKKTKSSFSEDFDIHFVPKTLEGSQNLGQKVG